MSLPKVPAKILFILPSLSAGGAERVLITLMNGLDRERFQSCLVSVLDKGPLEPLIDAQIPRKILGEKGVFRALPALYRTLKDEKPVVVISTMAHMNFTLLLLRPFFPKTVFIVREAITPSFILDTHPIFAPLIKLAYKILYGNASVVLSPSRIILDEFEDMGMHGPKFRLLYNPVRQDPIDRAPILTRNDLSVAPDEILFVASGRLHHQKGFDRLVSALRNFSGKWKLLILGEGEQRAELEHIIRQNDLQNRVILSGHKDTPWSYYKAADCFLLPSRWEGLPNVALESLACGTRVIAMKEAGGIGEIANLCATSDVSVVETMGQFLAEMRKVQPKTSGAKSLLPENFEESRVLSDFTSILTATTIQ